MGVKGYTDYREVLELDDVDAVQIATPHYSHADTLLLPLKAGKDVLTEKPMAITVEDMEANDQDNGRVRPYHLA